MEKRGGRRWTTVPEMSRHVAFLRAINTTGRRTKNAHLSEAFRSVGASYAQGFIASGNVIFDIDNEVDVEFINQVEAAFLKTYGFDIPTIHSEGDQRFGRRAVRRIPQVDAQARIHRESPGDEYG